MHLERERVEDKSPPNITAGVPPGQLEFIEAAKNNSSPMGGDALKRLFFFFSFLLFPFPNCPSLGLSVMYYIAKSQRFFLAKYSTPSPDAPPSHYRFFCHSPGLNPTGPIPWPLSSTSALSHPLASFAALVVSMVLPNHLLNLNPKLLILHLILPKIKLLLLNVLPLKHLSPLSFPNPSWRGNCHWRPQKCSDNCPSQVAGCYWVIQSGQVSSSIPLQELHWQEDWSSASHMISTLASNKGATC